MNTRLLEIYLARLYADPAECERFLTDPRAAAAQAGLGDAEIRELERIDRVGLRLASTSFSKKRGLRPASGTGGLMRRLLGR